jgi:hypothetical protein
VKAPKSEKSRRRLTVPASMGAPLRAHGERQAFERRAIEVHWHDTGFVFTTTIGTPLDPRNVLRAWHALLAAASVPCRSFQVTRHTAGSHLDAVVSLGYRDMRKISARNGTATGTRKSRTRRPGTFSTGRGIMGTGRPDRRDVGRGRCL